MSVHVIVDDSDPNIIYSPRSSVTGQSINVHNEAAGWLVGGVGASNIFQHTILAAMAHVQSGGSLVFPEADVRAFLTTISGAGKASSTMSYNFNGAK